MNGLFKFKIKVCYIHFYWFIVLKCLVNRQYDFNCQYAMKISTERVFPMKMNAVTKFILVHFQQPGYKNRIDSYWLHN